MGNSFVSESDGDGSVITPPKSQEQLQKQEQMKHSLKEFLKERHLEFRFDLSQLSSGDFYHMRVKFVVVGDSGVGKTCLIHRWHSGTFNPNPYHTIGVDFHTRIEEHRNLKICFQLWDTAGQERFRKVTFSYLAHSFSVVIVFDVTNESSWHSVSSVWLPAAKSLCPPDCPIMLIGTKIDRPDVERKVSLEEVTLFAQKNQLIYTEISNKENVNVDKILPQLASAVLNTLATSFQQFSYKPDYPMPSLFNDSKSTVNSLFQASVSEAITQNQLTFPVLFRTQRNRKTISARLEFPCIDKQLMRIHAFTGILSLSSTKDFSIHKVHISRLNRIIYPLDDTNKGGVALQILDQSTQAIDVISHILLALKVKIVETHYESHVDDIIQSCKLDGLRMKPFDRTRIALRIKELTKSSKLDLTNCIPSPTVAKYLVNAVRWTDLVNVLNLSGNNLDDKFIPSLVNVLMQNSSIRHLLLDRNLLTHVAANHFTKLMDSPFTAIEYLSLTQNNLGDAGASILIECWAQIAEKNHMKPSLILSDNNLTATVMFSVCKSIEQFKLIDVSDNIDLKDDAAVIKELEGDRVQYLERMNLSRTPLADSDQVKRLISLIEKKVDKAIIQRVDQYSEHKNWLISEDELDRSYFSRLGEGAQGAVYSAFWRGTPIAVKEVYHRDTNIGYLIDEVTILFHVKHPNCLSLLGLAVNERDSKILIVTELMNRTLKSALLDSNVYLSAAKKINIATQIARALNHLHLMKPLVLHRDIKPDNIFLDETLSTVKVGDFGLSAVTDRSLVTETLLGTREYLAPELVFSQEIKYTAACDVYSFAIVLWQIWFQAAMPYPINHLTGGPFALFKKVSDGLRPSSDAEPDSTMLPIHSEMMDLIASCWGDASERPHFSLIVTRLEQLKQKL